MLPFDNDQLGTQHSVSYADSPVTSQFEVVPGPIGRKFLAVIQAGLDPQSICQRESASFSFEGDLLEISNTCPAGSGEGFTVSTREAGKIISKSHDAASAVEKTLANSSIYEQKNNISKVSQADNVLDKILSMSNSTEKADERMRATFELRRTRILEQVANFKSVSAFARHYNLDAGYIRQIKTGQRNVGEKVARDLEEAIGLPLGWLDIPHGEELFLMLRAALRGVPPEGLQDLKDLIELRADQMRKSRQQTLKSD